MLIGFAKVYIFFIPTWNIKQNILLLQLKSYKKEKYWIKNKNEWSRVIDCIINIEILKIVYLFYLIYYYILHNNYKIHITTNTYNILIIITMK